MLASLVKLKLYSKAIPIEFQTLKKRSFYEYFSFDKWWRCAGYESNDIPA